MPSPPLACCTRGRLLRPLALLALLAAAPVARADGLDAILSVGYGSFTHRGDRGTLGDGGLALGLRVEGRVAPRIGLGGSFTWGLTDWDRAGEYIAAGNRAGSWTTDQFAKVERWATDKDAKEDTRGLRMIGLVFADMFLALSYAAVPACYASSAGGATSWLQLDGTVSFHLAPAETAAAGDGWVELGLGAATLPYRVEDWRSAYGPVGGMGMRYRWLRVGARVLWSPPGLNRAAFGGTVSMAALTLGVVL